MTQASGRKFLWSILLVALIVRLGAAFVVNQIVAKTPGQLCLIPGDAEGYWILAGKVATGQTYSIYVPERRAMRMPGFPILLALPQLVFGNNPPAVRYVLAIVGTMACGFTYWLGRELSGDLVGLIACLYTAISPSMVLFSVLFLSETAFAAALLASLIAAAKLVRDPAPAEHRGRASCQALITGVLMGVTTYMRPTWILVAPALFVLIAVFGKNSLGMRLMLGCWVCMGLCLILSPWTIRNVGVTHHFVPTTLWVGPSLYDGLNRNATGDSNMQFFEDDNLLQKMSEYDMDQEYRRRAKEFAVADPARVLSLAVTKQSRYWSPAPGSAEFKRWYFSVAGWLAYLPLILFALIGFWIVRRDVWFCILTAAPIFYFAGLHLLFVGSLRYRLPAEYPLAVLASLGFVRVFRRDRDRLSVTLSPANDR